MKILLTLILMLTTQSYLISQLSSYEIGCYRKSKYEIMDISKPNNYIDNKILDEDYIWVFYGGITFKYKYILILEYSHEFIMAGYKYSNTRSGFGGTQVSMDECNNFNLLLGYQIFNKKKVNVVPVLGIGYARSSYYFGTFGVASSWSQPNEDGSFTYSQCLSEWKKDYGLYKNYYFAKINLKFTYQPFEYFTTFLQAGYNQGFRTIGDWVGWVQISDELRYEIKNRSTGTYYFLSIGAELNFNINKENK